jgi:hypothetical protein
VEPAEALLLAGARSWTIVGPAVGPPRPRRRRPTGENGRREHESGSQVSSSCCACVARALAMLRGRDYVLFEPPDCDPLGRSAAETVGH